MNLYWNIDNQQMLASLYGGTLPTVTMVLRDKFPVDLYLVTAQASVIEPYAVTTITAGHAVKFGAKLALSDTTYLAEQDTWTETGSGATTHYAAAIPLDGATLIAAMAGLSALDLLAEFTTQDADGKHYLSTKWALRVIPDVITGSEA
jgi:hypothetical protein